MSPASQTHARRNLVVLMVVAAVFLLGGLTETGLWAPDEPRFAAVAQEMERLERGALDLVVLRLNGDVYTQKPPLFYWIASALGALSGGTSELSVRLPSALAGIASIAVCFALALRMTGSATVGLVSGAILLSVHQFAHLARRAQLDVILTLWISLALLAYWQLRSNSGQTSRWRALMHLSMGLGLLTKGPVALLPIVIIALHLAWEGRFSLMRRCFSLPGVALMLGPVLLWIAAASLLAPDGFFQSAVVDNVWGRFARGTAHVRPIFYYVYHFPLDFMPWTLLWPLVGIHVHRTLRASSPRDEEDPPALRSAMRLLLVWIAFYFVFFSISAGKRGLYLLPCFPAVAILCGMTLERSFARNDAWPRPLSIALLLGVGAAGGFGVWLAAAGGLVLDRYPGFELPGHFGVVLAGISVSSALAAFVLARKQSPYIARFAIVVATVLAIEGTAFRIAYPAFDPEKSPRAIALAAAAVTPADAQIGVFDQRDLIGGIVFYADRRAIELRTPEEARAFFDDGGHAMIVKAEKLDRTGISDRLTVQESTRSGRRRLLLVVPSGG